MLVEIAQTDGEEHPMIESEEKDNATCELIPTISIVKR